MKNGSSLMLRLLRSPHKGRAKDGSLSAAGGVAAMGGVVGRRIAWAQSLAVFVDSPGDDLRAGAANGDHLAASRRDQRRLRRLLLLPATPGTQDQTPRPAAVDDAPGACGHRPARAAGGGRFAHQTVWPEGARRRHSSQPNAWP